MQLYKTISHNVLHIVSPLSAFISLIATQTDRLDEIVSLNVIVMCQCKRLLPEGDQLTLLTTLKRAQTSVNLKGHSLVLDQISPI